MSKTDVLVVRGGNRLSGKVPVSGAKNSILPLLFGTLLAEGDHTFHNVPELSDVTSCQEILKFLNADLSFLEPGQVRVRVKSSSDRQIPYELMRKMRASILALGPLVAKYGEAEVPLPGGCAIGSRPVDLHLKGLEKLGATIELSGGMIKATARGGLKPNRYLFDFPTVTGTENLMMAAALTPGETCLENVAKEPEIVQLAEFLKGLGVEIEGAGTGTMLIFGKKPGDLKPNKVATVVIPDRVEAATLLLAGPMTGGDVWIDRAVGDYLGSFKEKVIEAGGKWETDDSDSSIRLNFQNGIQATQVKTAVYPGFPTDLQSQWMAFMCLANGTSQISETIFENRFMHVQELMRLGAKITVEGKTASVRGENPSNFSGARVMATDLRASASLVLLALTINGESQIEGLEHLDRGYEKFSQKMQKLGADITRVKL